MVPPPGTSEISDASTGSVSQKRVSDGQNSDVEAEMVSPEAQKRQEPQETSTFGTMSTDTASSAGSFADSAKKEEKQAHAQKKDISEADTASSVVDSRFKGYQPSAPDVNPAKKRMTLDDLRQLQQQHKDESGMSQSSQSDQGAMVRLQRPQSSGQDQTTVETAAPADTTTATEPKGRGKRSLESMKNRLKGLVRRDTAADGAATSVKSETTVDYAKLLAERDEEISTLRSRIQTANTRAFDLETEFGKFRQASSAHLSEITDAFKRQMSDMEDKQKAEREEMMALTRGLRSEIDQLRAELKRPVDLPVGATETDGAGTETDVKETIDEIGKQVQLFRPETNQSTGDLSTAMTRPSLPSLHHPRFQQLRPPMPSIFGLPPSPSFGGFSPFAPSSMMPFHHPAGILSSFAPPSMAFPPKHFGLAPSLGHHHMPPTMSSMIHPSRKMPSFEPSSFGDFTDDMGIGAGSALTNLQSKLSAAMKQARKEDDDMTTASVVEDDGTGATGFFRRSTNGYTMGQGFKFGNGMMSTMSSVSRF